MVERQILVLGHFVRVRILPEQSFGEVPKCRTLSYFMEGLRPEKMIWKQVSHSIKGKNRVTTVPVTMQNDVELVIFLTVVLEFS